MIDRFFALPRSERSPFVRRLRATYRLEPLRVGKVDDDCSARAKRPWKVVKECVLTLII